MNKKTTLSIILIFLTLFGVYQTGQKHITERLLVEETEYCTELELQLKDLEDSVYEVTLDLENTNRTLVTTAEKLDIAEKSLEELEHIKLKYVGEYTCTAYCTERYPHICGTGSGNTASGAPVTANVSVATTDFNTFSYGDIIYIEDVGIRIIQDTGGFSPNKLDIAVAKHSEATHWKKQGKHKVWILEMTENGEE